MKKITSILIMFIFIASLVSINQVKAEDLPEITDAEIDQETEALIQDVSDPDLAEVGTTPDQSGYGLKLAMEKIRLALTFNRAKKAELSLNMAELRLKEARLMAAKNKLESLERIRNEHRKYLDIAERNIDSSDDDSEDALEKQARIEIKLKEQKGQVEELESLILLKAKGLTEEQKQKLLELIKEFEAENEDLELKITDKTNVVKTRLKAKGLSEDEIEIEFEHSKNETINLTREDILERKASHKIDQAEKMYNLAARLIKKVQNRYGNETNTTSNKTIKFSISDTTLELHAKAKSELDQAKLDLEAKEYFKAIENAHDSKKLSALTIASIHRGINDRAMEERLEKIEIDKLKEYREEERRLTEEQIKALKERRKELEEKLKERIKQLKEHRNGDDDNDDLDDDDKTNTYYICVDETSGSRVYKNRRAYGDSEWIKFYDENGVLIEATPELSPGIRYQIKTKVKNC